MKTAAEAPATAPEKMDAKARDAILNDIWEAASRAVLAALQAKRPSGAVLTAARQLLADNGVTAQRLNRDTPMPADVARTLALLNPAPFGPTVDGDSDDGTAEFPLPQVAP